ncbi:Rieske (2Fe-2S) protein [Microlunatus soli]|nr:Rieske (2Fe-2S) protein [Microlunatus soli]
MVDAFVKPTTTRSRRELFRSIGMVALGGATAVLAACSGGSGASGGGGGSAAASTGPITVAKSSVPEGSGVIKGAYVVTQPTAGDFKAFSSKCTHEGCPLSAVDGDAIVCNCHGSQFSVKDGSVLHPPAQKPLPAATVSVDGDDLKVSG